MVSRVLALLGLIVAPALYDAAGCEGNFVKGMWGCVIDGHDVTALIALSQLTGLLALPLFLLAAAAMAIIDVVTAGTWFRHQR